MRVGRFFLILFLFSVLAAGCSRPAPVSDPRAVLTAYLEALIDGRNDDAAQYLATGSKRPDGKQENGSFEERMVRRALASHMSFEVLKVETSEGRGRADVKFISPDFRIMAADIAGQLRAAEFPRDGIAAMEYTAHLVNSRIRLYKSRGIPTTASVRTYLLTNEAGTWKIAGCEANG